MFIKEFIEEDPHFVSSGFHKLLHSGDLLDRLDISRWSSMVTSILLVTY